MDWNWLHSLIYGAIGGFFEFLPVPTDAQQHLMMRLSGVDQPYAICTLCAHLGCLFALYFSCYNRIAKLRRENKIASIPMRKRKRQPDPVSLMESKLLRFGIIPFLLTAVIAPVIRPYFGREWVLALLLLLNAAVILAPQYLPGSNKDARSLSPLDSVLIGLGGVVGAIPGISGIAGALSVAKMRGTDQQYSLDFVYLLFIPALLAMCIADVVLLVLAGGSGLDGWAFLHGLLTMVSAAAAAFGGITFMRFLAVKIGFSGFAYYSAGLGMFTFILYLIG